MARYKNYKSKANYNMGQKKCFDTCTCIQCKKKKPKVKADKALNNGFHRQQRKINPR